MRRRDSSNGEERARSDPLLLSESDTSCKCDTDANSSSIFSLWKLLLLFIYTYIKIYIFYIYNIYIFSAGASRNCSDISLLLSSFEVTPAFYLRMWCMVVHV